MKLIGFMLVILSAACCGLCVSTAKSERLDELMSFSSMLEHMQAELLSHQRALPDMVDKLSSLSSGRAQTFIKLLSTSLDKLGKIPLEDIWYSCLHESTASLNEAELNALASISSVLGKYDVEHQAKLMGEVKNILDSALKKESAELPQYKKSALGITASAGAMLAILLL